MSKRNRCGLSSCGCHHHNFKYEFGGLVWYEVPKCASSSIKNIIKSVDLKNVNKNVSFAVVRNPYDRFVSNYKMFTTQNSRKKQLKLMGIDPNISFQDFTSAVTKEKIVNHHWIPMDFYIPNDCNIVLRLESDDFVDSLNSILNVDVEVPHRNKTKVKNYRLYYDDRIQFLIKKYYDGDLKRFDYEF